MPNYGFPANYSGWGTPSTYNTDWSKAYGVYGQGSPGSRWYNYASQLPDWEIENIDIKPDQGWQQYGSVINQGMSGNFNRWLGNQFDRYYSQYRTNTNGDPTEWWSEYMMRINPYADFSMSDPISRGERQNLLTNTMRMVR